MRGKFCCLLFSERKVGAGLSDKKSVFCRGEDEAENLIFRCDSGGCGVKFFCLLFSERKVGAELSLLY
ncbi:MAG: hypothetical protein ACI4QR_02060 [Eubacteriales bacterium]